MPGNSSLFSALDDLCLRRARFSRATVENETYLLQRFVACVGDIQVRHLTPGHVEKWFYGSNGVVAEHKARDGLTRARVQLSTHNYYRSPKKSFFAYCTARDLHAH